MARGAGEPTVFSIGFTQSSAQDFFDRLQRSGAKHLIDVRLSNSSQLAGFAKAGDLAFFLDRLCGIAYRSEPLLAPTKELMDLAHKKRWEEWESGYVDLLRQRKVARKLDPAEFEGACLLCAERSPHRCHRRLAIDYLGAEWKTPLHVKHL